MCWAGSWRFLAPFQFGFPVWVLTAKLVLGEPSGVGERRAACSSLVACLGRQPPLWRVGTGCLPSDSARWPAGGSFVSSAPSGLGLLDNGAASSLRGVGLPQCPPARRRCKREKWGRSRRFLCPAEYYWRSISEDSGGKELHVQNSGFLVRFLYDLEDGQWCSLV